MTDLLLVLDRQSCASWILTQWGILTRKRSAVWEGIMYISPTETLYGAAEQWKLTKERSVRRCVGRNQPTMESRDFKIQEHRYTGGGCHYRAQHFAKICGWTWNLMARRKMRRMQWSKNCLGMTDELWHFCRLHPDEMRNFDSENNTNYALNTVIKELPRNDGWTLTCL